MLNYHQNYSDNRLLVSGQRILNVPTVFETCLRVNRIARNISRVKRPKLAKNAISKRP